MSFVRLSLVGLFVVAISTQIPLGDVVSARQADPSREALFSAIQRGAVADVERLLGGGASADVVNAEGTPALMAATLFGGADMVKLLLDRKADPSRTDAAGATALMWAIPDVEKVRLLLAAGANVNAQSKTGRTPLLVAAAYPGTVALVRLLVERGADVRAQDGAGTTTLALAVRSADIDVVRFLVERGLDPKALSAAAFRAALARRDRATTDYLMANGPGPAPDTAITAAVWQPAALVDRWIMRGADVNARNAPQYGRTALLTAVTSEAAGADTVKLLLERGSDPNVRTTDGESPLDWAIY
ncbi:MAG: ankyrin repeat domain-containing protein, partial [Vicinamibacterales bacterium]